VANLNGTEVDAWLEDVIRERFAGRSAVRSIRRSRLPHIGSYDCHRVTVEFVDGAVKELFLKDFACSRQTKDFVEQRRLRELRVYRELLDAAALGTPAFYGAQWDENRGRFQMLLELLDGEVVADLDERNGLPAVEWLAVCQAHFLENPDELEHADFLIEHDTSYFCSKAEDARCDVSELAPESAARLEEVLTVYESTIGRMSALPRCLVHGGYIPWHIFVDRRANPFRVAAVDWELAARGSLLYDLAIFVDDASPVLQRSLVQAYRSAATRRDVPLPNDATMNAGIECFRLHRIIDWLSRSAEKSFSRRKIASLLTRAEERCRTIIAAY